MVPHEVGFFAKDDLYAKGTDWYESLFSPAQEAKCMGENSNYYTMKELYPLACSRLIDYIQPSKFKLIYIVRDPLEMIQSFWIEKRSHGGEEVHYDFNVAVKKNTEWLLNVANYWQQLAIYRQHFLDEQILIVFLEDLKADQTRVMQACYSFLGVNSDFASELSATRLNASQDKKLVSPLKSRLRQLQGYKALVHLLPQSAKSFLDNQLFRKPVTTRPEWDKAIKAWVVGQLHNDIHEFLKYCDKPAEFWEDFNCVLPREVAS